MPRLLRQPTVRKKPIDDLFAELPGFVQQTQVGGIADRLRRYGGIQDQLALVFRRFFGAVDVVSFLSATCLAVGPKQVLEQVEKYKDVRGVLMFALGNESNYGLSWSSFEIENLP